MRRLAVCLLSLSVMPLAMAADASLQGVWQGTLGGADIVACFNQPGSGSDSSGSYYYTRYKAPIMLSKDQGKTAWKETDANNQVTGNWSLNPPQGGNITGSWTHPKTGKSLPVALRLLAAAGGLDHPTCASDAYNTALEAMPPLKTAKPVTFEGRQYRNLSLADAITVELLAPGDGVAKINAQLRDVLPKNKAELAGYFKARRQHLGQNGWAAEDEVHADPTYWSARWVTIKFYRWAAGYGSSGISMNYRTWNLKSGQETDVWTWFGTRASQGDDKSELPSRLRQALFKDAVADPECKGDYPGKGRYHLTLKADGVSFREDARGSGCEEDFLLPYDKVAPFLTPQGRAALSDLLPKATPKN